MRKLNCHNLLKNLNSLCKFLNETYCINQGGCCFVASLIAKHLDKLGIKYDLVIYDHYKKHEDLIEYEIVNCHRNTSISSSVTGYCGCYHYCLRIKGAGVVNENNSQEETEYQYIISKISYKNIKWIYKNSKWNDSYDTKYNKVVRNIVKEFFKEYESFSFF